MLLSIIYIDKRGYISNISKNEEIGGVIRVVEVAVSIKKNLHKIPLPIKKKLFTWVAAVEERGLNEVRRIPGYHDEPLKGDRQGQRSIRLDKQ